MSAAGRSQFWGRAQRIALAAALAALPMTPDAAAQSASGETTTVAYAAKWSEALAALAAFATAPARVGGAADGKAVAAACEQARGRFAAAVGWLIEQYPPRAQARQHYRLLPLLEEQLGAMTAISRGLAADDAQQVAIGRRWFADTVAELERILDDLEHSRD